MSQLQSLVLSGNRRLMDFELTTSATLTGSSSSTAGLLPSLVNLYLPTDALRDLASLNRLRALLRPRFLRLSSFGGGVAYYRSVNVIHTWSTSNSNYFDCFCVFEFF